MEERHIAAAASAAAVDSSSVHGSCFSSLASSSGATRFHEVSATQNRRLGRDRRSGYDVDGFALSEDDEEDCLQQTVSVSALSVGSFFLPLLIGEGSSASDVAAPRAGTQQRLRQVSSAFPPQPSAPERPIWSSSSSAERGWTDSVHRCCHNGDDRGVRAADRSGNNSVLRRMTERRSGGNNAAESHRQELIRRSSLPLRCFAHNSGHQRNSGQLLDLANSSSAAVSAPLHFRSLDPSRDSSHQRLTPNSRRQGNALLSARLTRVPPALRSRAARPPRFALRLSGRHRELDHLSSSSQHFVEVRRRQRRRMLRRRLAQALTHGGGDSMSIELSSSVSSASSATMLVEPISRPREAVHGGGEGSRVAVIRRRRLQSFLATEAINSSVRGYERMVGAGGCGGDWQVSSQHVGGRLSEALLRGLDGNSVEIDTLTVLSDSAPSSVTDFTTAYACRSGEANARGHFTVEQLYGLEQPRRMWSRAQFDHARRRTAAQALHQVFTTDAGELIEGAGRRLRAPGAIAGWRRLARGNEFPVPNPSGEAVAATCIRENFRTAVDRDDCCSPLVTTREPSSAEEHEEYLNSCGDRRRAMGSGTLQIDHQSGMGSGSLGSLPTATASSAADVMHDDEDDDGGDRPAELKTRTPPPMCSHNGQRSLHRRFTPSAELLSSSVGICDGRSVGIWSRRLRTFVSSIGEDTPGRPRAPLARSSSFTASNSPICLMMRSGTSPRTSTCDSPSTCRRSSTGLFASFRRCHSSSGISIPSVTSLADVKFATTRSDLSSPSVTSHVDAVSPIPSSPCRPWPPSPQQHKLLRSVGLLISHSHPLPASSSAMPWPTRRCRLRRNASCTHSNTPRALPSLKRYSSLQCSPSCTVSACGRREPHGVKSRSSVFLMPPSVAASTSVRPSRGTLRVAAASLIRSSSFDSRSRPLAPVVRRTPRSSRRAHPAQFLTTPQLSSHQNSAVCSPIAAAPHCSSPLSLFTAAGAAAAAATQHNWSGKSFVRSLSISLPCSPPALLTRTKSQ